MQFCFREPRKALYENVKFFVCRCYCFKRTHVREKQTTLGRRRVGTIDMDKTQCCVLSISIVGTCIIVIDIMSEVTSSFKGTFNKYITLRGWGVVDQNRDKMLRKGGGGGI